MLQLILEKVVVLWERCRKKGLKLMKLFAQVTRTGHSCGWTIRMSIHLCCCSQSLPLKSLLSLISALSCFADVDCKCTINFTSFPTCAFCFSLLVRVLSKHQPSNASSHQHYTCSKTAEEDGWLQLPLVMPASVATRVTSYSSFIWQLPFILLLKGFTQLYNCWLHG